MTSKKMKNTQNRVTLGDSLVFASTDMSNSNRLGA